MYWLAKVAAMKGLGAAPGGMKVYSAVQRIVTKSTVPTTARIDEKLAVGAEYLAALQGRVPVPISAITHVDIGTGWMPTIPMLFYSVGVQRQVLCDIRPHLALDTAEHTAALVAARLGSLPSVGGFPMARVPPSSHGHGDVASYLSSLGMHYRAPYTLAALSEAPGWTVVTCTQVLLHLRYREIVELLRAVAKAIAGGGVFVTTIHLYDLYADTDRHISRFNKYRYPDWVWDRFCTSRAMYFNRLTISDYRNAVADAGLQLLECQVKQATDEQRRELSRVRIHRRFRHVPEEELAAQRLLLVAEAGERA
jgi:hypothetical protein